MIFLRVERVKEKKAVLPENSNNLPFVAADKILFYKYNQKAGVTFVI